jgi:hypothetical protein
MEDFRKDPQMAEDLQASATNSSSEAHTDAHSLTYPFHVLTWFRLPF